MFRLTCIILVTISSISSANAGDSSSCSLSLYEKQVTQRVYLAKKSDITVVVKNNGWTDLSLTNNKSLTLNISGCPVLVGYTNNINFMDDMKSDLDQHISEISSDYVILDLSNLIDSNDHNDIIQLNVRKSERIRSADEYSLDLQQTVKKIDEIMSR